MKLDLSRDNVKRLMREAVLERGEDYSYPEEEKRRYAGQPTCTYAKYNKDNEPVGCSCIVGDVLVRAGLPVTMLPRFENKGAQLVADLLAGDGLVNDLSGQRALAEAQFKQDAGSTWGEAFQAAFGEPVGA